LRAVGRDGHRQDNEECRHDSVPVHESYPGRDFREKSSRYAPSPVLSLRWFLPGQASPSFAAAGVAIIKAFL
jgi:hypothetical protein